MKLEIHKALVTGGAGFIGSHITEELLKRGCQVTVIDDLSTGRIKNLEPFLTHKNLNFVRGSIINLSLLRQYSAGMDCVFHQAAIPSVARSIQNPQATHEANVNGTLNVLTAARDHAVKKIVFASSAAVYGDTSLPPNREGMLPNPQSPYAVSKIAAEYYCRVFDLVYKLPAVCLRYFNVYGPRQDPDSQYSAVIPKFIQSALQGKSLTIYGDGEQTRDFVYVRDVVAANLLAAESPRSGIFNIGTGERISVNRLAAIILKTLGQEGIKPVYDKERPGEIKHSLADISAAGSIGYKPAWKIEKGLNETIKSSSLSL